MVLPMSRTVIFLIALMLLLGWGMENQSSQAADPPGVAVVELFTSEGCSSCPPADKVLMKLVASQEESNASIYCLTFHVDYWDDLGWPDRFADKRFTVRQRSYAQAMNLRSIYTPQMIVNGQTEFVGSNAKTAAQAITAAQQTPSKVSITLSTKRLAGGKVKAHYDLTGQLEKAVIHIALVEAGLETAVQRGENAGETLKHANVVRAWESVDLQSKTDGDVTLELPRGIDLTESRVIAFVQDPMTRQVLGAIQTEPLESIAPAGR